MLLLSQCYRTFPVRPPEGQSEGESTTACAEVEEVENPLHFCVLYLPAVKQMPVISQWNNADSNVSLLVTSARATKLTLQLSLAPITDFRTTVYPNTAVSYKSPGRAIIGKVRYSSSK